MFEIFGRAALDLRPPQAQTSNMLFLHPRFFMERLAELRKRQDVPPDVAQIAGAIHYGWKDAHEALDQGKVLESLRVIHRITFAMDRSVITLDFKTQTRGGATFVLDSHSGKNTFTIHNDDDPENVVRVASNISTERVWYNPDSAQFHPSDGIGGHPILRTPTKALEMARTIVADM